MKAIAIPISLVHLSVEMHCCRRKLECDAYPTPDMGRQVTFYISLPGITAFPCMIFLKVDLSNQAISTIS